MIASVVLAAALAIPPRPADYVTDNAGAMSTTAAQRIRTELQTYEQTTKHHVIVWIGETTGDTPLEDWTIHAAEQWRVGRKGHDDGAILFIFMRDRKVRIEVGYGLESALPDASAGEIIRDTIVPHMRAGDVDGAVQSGVDKMLLTITPSFASQIHHDVSEAAETQTSSSDQASIGALILMVFIVLFLLFVYGATRRGRRSGVWYWGGGGYSGGGWSGGGGGGFSGSFGGGFGGGGASGGW